MGPACSTRSVVLVLDSIKSFALVRCLALEREAANAPSRLRAPHPLSVSARLSVRWAGMSRSVDGLYLNTGSISPRRGGTFYYTLAAVQQVGVRARVRKRASRPRILIRALCVHLCACMRSADGGGQQRGAQQLHLLEARVRRRQLQRQFRHAVQRRRPRRDQRAR